MNIAVVTRNYDPSGGGAERYCVELSEHLTRMGIRIHVYSQITKKKSVGINFTAISLPIAKPRFLNQLIFSYLTKKKIGKNFDLIHSHELISFADLYTVHVPCFKTKYLAPKRFFHRILNFLRIASSPRVLSYLWLESRQFSLHSKPEKKFISVSNLLKENIARCYPGATKSITVAYPGLHPNHIKSNLNVIGSRPYRNNLTILFVAHNFVRKGLQTLIDALEYVKNQNIRLVVAGDGNPKLINLDHLSDAHQVEFIGVVRNKKLLYADADALIHPTFGDTFGMVVLEAMSYGLPVVVSSQKYCGISELLSNEKNALIIDNPHSASNLGQLIMKLAHSPRLFEILSTNSLSFAKKMTWERTAASTIAAIRSQDIYD